MRRSEVRILSGVLGVRVPPGLLKGENMMNKLKYTSTKTLEVLGCTEEQLEVLVREGKIRRFRFNGLQAYDIEEIDALALETKDKLPHEIISDKFLDVLHDVVSFAKAQPPGDDRLAVLLGVNEIEATAVKMVENLKKLEKTL